MMWVVYDHPTDYPFGYLARRWRVGSESAEATDERVVGISLAAVRAQLPVGLVRLARAPEDDPVVVETWL